MKRHLASGILLVMGVFAIGCAAPDEDEDPAEVRQAIEAKSSQFESYVAQQNIDSMLVLYTSDAILMPQGAEMVSGQEAMRAAFQGMADQGMTNMDLETIEVEAADGLAYEVYRYTIRGPGGETVDRGKGITTWKKVDGDWKLHRDIWNSDSMMPMDSTHMHADSTGMAADSL